MRNLFWCACVVTGLRPVLAGRSPAATQNANLSPSASTQILDTSSALYDGADASRIAAPRRSGCVRPHPPPCIPLTSLPPTDCRSRRAPSQSSDRISLTLPPWLAASCRKTPADDLVHTPSPQSALQCSNSSCP